MKKLLLIATLVFLTGCVSYTQTDAQGNKTSFVSFLKKAELSGAEISKDGLKVKGASTTGDVDMVKALAEGAVSGAIKGAK